MRWLLHDWVRRYVAEGTPFAAKANGAGAAASPNAQESRS